MVAGGHKNPIFESSSMTAGGHVAVNVLRKLHLLRRMLHKWLQKKKVPRKLQMIGHAKYGAITANKPVTLAEIAMLHENLSSVSYVIRRGIQKNIVRQ